MKNFKDYFYLKEPIFKTNTSNTDVEYFKLLKDDILKDIINRSNNNEIDNINIASFNLPSLPNLNNFKVIKNFKCSSNKLITLEGSPSSVGGDFYCSGNKLISIMGASKIIGGGFYCNSMSTLRYLENSGIEYIEEDMNLSNCENIHEDQWQYLPIIGGALITDKDLNRNEYLTLQRLQAQGRIGKLVLTGQIEELEDDDPFNI
jgi:hypothetical protein